MIPAWHISGTWEMLVQITALAHGNDAHALLMIFIDRGHAVMVTLLGRPPC
jgi:hypothetical protein